MGRVDVPELYPPVPNQTAPYGAVQAEKGAAEEVGATVVAEEAEWAVASARLAAVGQPAPVKAVGEAVPRPF